MKRTSVWLSLRVVCVLFLLGMALVAIPAQAQTFAYVANDASGSVSVINTASNTVIATIPVGNAPYGVAFTPDGARVYVVNENSNSVSVIATDSNTVIATVSVGSDPIGVVITPDGTRAYVANQCVFNVTCYPNPGTVSVIDTNPADVATYNTVIATVPEEGEPVWLAITPDGSRVYSPNPYSDIVSVIDTGSNTVIATIPSGVLPTGVAITPDGTRAYVTNGSPSGTVSVIDTNPADAAYNTVIATVAVGGSPYLPAITPDGTRVYVANEGSNNVSVLNTVGGAITTIPIGSVSYGVAIAPDGTRAYVTSQSDTLSVIDTNPSDASFNTVIAVIGVGSFPIGVAVTPGIGPPTNKDQCKDGGWETFTIPRKFKNQGDCVSFVNTGK
jgi:YVTN family beta-propeller protein